LEDVKECEEIRMGFTRKKPYLYLYVKLKGNPEYEKIHVISSLIEAQVRSFIPNARVALRTESERNSIDGAWFQVNKIAEEEPGSRGAHNIHVRNLDGKLGVDFDLELGAGLTMEQSRDVSMRIEKKIRTSDAGVIEVVIHAESVSELVSSERSGHGSEIKWYIEHVVERLGDITLLSAPTIRREGNGLHLLLRTTFNSGSSGAKEAEIISALDVALRQGYPAISKVDVIDKLP
jgi:hypothetical protein